MRQGEKLFKVIILIIGIVVVSFDFLFYNFCEKQKQEISSLKDNQDVESEFNTNKFKYQADQIERASLDVKDVQGQIKDLKDALDQANDALSAQKDALLQEVEKRQQVENESKSIQKSLVDITAEADAIKKDMQGWEKDYVGVLAQLEKKIDDAQLEVKNFEDHVDALNIPALKESIISLNDQIEKVNSQAVNSSLSSNVPTTVPDPDKNIEHEHLESQ